MARNHPHATVESHTATGCRLRAQSRASVCRAGLHSYTAPQSRITAGRPCQGPQGKRAAPKSTPLDVQTPRTGEEPPGRQRAYVSNAHVTRIIAK